MPAGRASRGGESGDGSEADTGGEVRFVSDPKKDTGASVHSDSVRKQDIGANVPYRAVPALIMGSRSLQARSDSGSN